MWLMRSRALIEELVVITSKFLGVSHRYLLSLGTHFRVGWWRQGSRSGDPDTLDEIISEEQPVIRCAANCEWGPATVDREPVGRGRPCWPSRLAASWPHLGRSGSRAGHLGRCRLTGGRGRRDCPLSVLPLRSLHGDRSWQLRCRMINERPRGSDFGCSQRDQDLHSIKLHISTQPAGPELLTNTMIAKDEPVISNKAPEKGGPLYPDYLRMFMSDDPEKT